MPNRPSLFDPQAVRDDSGGDYGVWSNPENQSWYDWLKMKASDVQEAGKNVQSGLLSALSPYGAEGWQVPPAIQEPINAFHRLGENSVFPDGRLGIPNPSNVDNQNDVLTGLLSLYGGNALNPASVIPKGALASGALRTADEAPLRMYHGTAADVPFETFKPSADGSFGPGVYLSDNPAVASRYALEQNNSRVFPLDVQGPLASMDDYLTALHANGRDPNAALKVLRDQGYTGVTGDLGSLSNPQNVTSMFKPGSVRSATTGETLFSDTGKPSLFGGVLAAENSTFSSRNASIFDPPSKPQRAFESDYPNGALADDTGRLTHDIEGRPLAAEHIAGRQTAGGSDVPIPAAVREDVATLLFGNKPDYVSAGELHRGDVGHYRVMAGPDGPQRNISVLGSLSEPVRGRVLAHEIGHGIDDLVGGRYGIPDDGLYSTKPGQGLGQVYHDLNDASWRRGKDTPKRYQTAPQHLGYRGDDVRAENMAEAIRAYMADPNYMKSVAPETAARIREYVNENPRLNKVIQFNSGTGLPSIWGSALAPYQEEPRNALLTY